MNVYPFARANRRQTSAFRQRTQVLSVMTALCQEAEPEVDVVLM